MRYLQVMDDAALKVLKAAENTKQVLAGKEEVLAGIRKEFERKSKEASLLALHILLGFCKYGRCNLGL